MSGEQWAYARRVLWSCLGVLVGSAGAVVIVPGLADWERWTIFGAMLVFAALWPLLHARLQPKKLGVSLGYSALWGDNELHNIRPQHVARCAESASDEPGNGYNAIDVVSSPFECDHGVAFDADAAKNLCVAEVRVRWPRHFGECPKGCGFSGIAYASREHCIMGDW